MNTVISIVISLLLVITVLCAKNEPIMSNQDSCTPFGGICVEECPSKELLSKDGSCSPENGKNLVCCHGLPKLLKSCEKRGGQCNPLGTCHGPKIDSEFNDCMPDEECCVLVT